MKAVAPLVIVAAALLLAGCSSSAPAESEPASTSEADSGGTSAESDAAASGDDACALVSSADLAGSLGVESIDGVAADGQQGLLQCTWDFSDTHAAIAQYTADADTFLPADIYPQGESAVEIPGATRGWADASIGTILVVKDNQGVLLVDIDPGGSGADQAQWSALAESILGRL